MRKCGKCRKKFKRAAGLGSHLQKVHGVPGSSPKSKRKRKLKKVRGTEKPVAVPGEAPERNGNGLSAAFDAIDGELERLRRRADALYAIKRELEEVSS